MSALSIVLIAIIALLAGMEGILDEFQFHQPLVACTLIGLVSGHPAGGRHARRLPADDRPRLGERRRRRRADAALASVASAIIMVLALDGGTADSQTAITTSIALAVPLSRGWPVPDDDLPHARHPHSSRHGCRRREGRLQGH